MAFERILKMLNRIINLDETAILNAILSDKDFQDYIISLNTEGQPTSQLYEHGLDSLSVSLGDYSPNTIEGTSQFRGKKEKGQRFDHITLKDTGDFYKSFKITVSNGGFTMTADPVKDDGNLFDDFGTNIVGLTEENLQLVRNAILEKIREEVKRVITLAA